MLRLLSENASGATPAQLNGILSASIAPVIVISGVALLLLTMTNRYSRVTDLARDMLRDLETVRDRPRREKLVQQVRIVYRRAGILRRAIIMASLCILFVTLTVLSLFAGQVLGIGSAGFSMPCFGLSLFALLGSLYDFIRDVSISLTALRVQTDFYIADMDPQRWQHSPHHGSSARPFAVAAKVGKSNRDAASALDV
jgi:hypothetical protein